MAGESISVENFGEYILVEIRMPKMYQAAVQVFRERMFSLLEDGHTRIILDLSDVEVMNSSGLGVILHMWDTLSNTGGNMTVTGLGPVMQELFERMRLDQLISVSKSLEEAVKQMVRT